LRATLCKEAEKNTAERRRDIRIHLNQKVHPSISINELLQWQISNQYISRRLLTKYVVGAKANPPKNERRPPKNGKVMAMNIVNAAMPMGRQ